MILLVLEKEKKAKATGCTMSSESGVFDEMSSWYNC